MQARTLGAVVALAAGALQALAIADPWSGRPHGALQIASLAALVAALRWPATGASTRPGWRRGFGLGWLFAVAWLAGTFWWLYISMHTYGGLNAALAVVAVLALAAFLGLYYALAGAVFCAAIARAPGYRRSLARAVLFAALWTLAELARGRWLTGFPWGAGGYAHVDGALAAFAPLVGVYGVGFVAALIAALVAEALLPLRGAARPRVPALAIAVLLLAWGALAPRLARDGANPALRMEVALLQGNIPQSEKFELGTGVADALRWYGEQLRDSRSALVVAPETAIPLLPAQLPAGYLQALQARFATPGQAALVGAPLGDEQAGYTNSVLGFAPGQNPPYRYDKHHLVPFGEFIPPFFRWFTDLMHIPLGDFNRGALDQPSFEWRGQRLAPNICYEDLFGEELAARFAERAAAPTAFVNVSNLAWFGDGVALDQHLSIARMRALEFQRPMLVATNSGLTAIIDHRGAVTHALPRSTRGVLEGEFEGRTQVTLYAAWAARWGLLPLWLACLLLAVASAAHLGGGRPARSK